MANYKSSKKAETRSSKKAETRSSKPAKSDFISDIRVFPVEDGNGILANVSVTFGGVFVVTDLKIIEGKKGAFVSMPQYKYKGEWKDSCFPITGEFREELSEAVLEAYADEVE